MSDPSGTLMDIKRFAVHDGPGIRTTLFLKGCPLRCLWCHNPEGVSPRPQMAYYAHKCIGCGACAGVCPSGAQALGPAGHSFDRAKCVVCGKCESVCLGQAMKRFGRVCTVDQAVAIAMEDASFYGREGGVTLSGGEPLLQADFAAAVLAEAKARGISTAIDTCGFAPWQAFEKVLAHTDWFLFDIKHADPLRHEALTGRRNEQILANLRALCQAGARVEARMPLVPGANDDPAALEGVGRALSGLPISRLKLLPYHSLARSKYRALGLEDTLPDVPAPSEEALDRAVSALRACGLNAVSAARA